MSPPTKTLNSLYRKRATAQHHGKRDHQQIQDHEVENMKIEDIEKAEAKLDERIKELRETAINQIKAGQFAMAKHWVEAIQTIATLKDFLAYTKAKIAYEETK